MSIFAVFKRRKILKTAGSCVELHDRASPPFFFFFESKAIVYGNTKNRFPRKFSNFCGEIFVAGRLWEHKTRISTYKFPGVGKMLARPT